MIKYFCPGRMRWSFRNFVFVKTSYTLNLISRANICVLDLKILGQLYQDHKPLKETPWPILQG